MIVSPVAFSLFKMWSVNILVLVILGVSFVSSENAVICYYGTWATYRYGNGQFNVNNVGPHLCTHLIYAFAGIDKQGSIISLDAWLDLPDNWGRDNFGKFNALKQKDSSLKTLLAVGGWNEGSGKYSTMAANATLRKNFIDSAIDILTTHGFDGLDLDWEYPSRRDSVHGAADIDNFTKLLRELREAFDSHGFLLTAAVASIGEVAVLSYDIPAISQSLDMINLMTYDMAGSWDPQTGYNAPLHRGEDFDTASTGVFTVEAALKYWINAGAPPEKLALGVPFYGNTFTLANSDVNGVSAPSTGPGLSGPYTATAGFLGYNEVCYKLQTELWNQRYDSLAKVPYAFKDSDWVTYDDANSIAAKIEYAKSLGINKVMIWSIETDDFHGLCGNGANPLLNAVNKALDGNFVVSTESSSSEGSTATSDETSSSTSSVAATTESASELVCQQEGFTPNPADCTSFYRCVRDSAGALVPKKFCCPAGLYWQQEASVCNYKNLVECNVA